MIRTPITALLFSASLLGACGGTAADTSEEGERSSSTSGAEVPLDRTETESVAPEEPVVLRSTIPIPVPQPAVRRARLSRALQAVWTHVEEQVSNARPAGPEEATVETVQVWADGPFRAWIEARRDALTATRDLLEAVPEEPRHERGVALALWAYALEDMGAQVAGAPVPEEIAHDAELLGIYIRSLNDSSLPLGQRAIELYADCQRRLAALGDDSPWLPWRAYCVQRGQEVIEGYGLENVAEPADVDDSTDPD